MLDKVIKWSEPTAKIQLSIMKIEFETQNVSRQTIILGFDAVAIYDLETLMKPA